MESVRIAPLDPPYEQEIVAQLMKWMPPAAAVEPLKLFRTLALHQDLFARMRPLGAGVLGSRVVDPDLREVMIHRTCARCGAEYEWGGRFQKTPRLWRAAQHASCASPRTVELSCSSLKPTSAAKDAAPCRPG